MATTIPILASDPALLYYGPHKCDECYAGMSPNSPRPEVMIVKLAREQGGAAFDYPDGPIYPNTVWKPHVHRTAAELDGY